MLAYIPAIHHFISPRKFYSLFFLILFYFMCPSFPPSALTRSSLLYSLPNYLVFLHPSE